jgi:hypothetical protein
MNALPEYFDPSELDHFAETFDPSAVVETADYSDRQILPVARYSNPYREIGKFTPKDYDGVKGVMFTLKLVGGLQSLEGGDISFGGDQALLSWPNTKLFNRGQNRPGKTSSLAEYLYACGIDTAGATLQDMIRLVPETLTTPVGVRVGLQERGKKQDDGTWKQINLNTKDFNIGTSKEPKFVYSIERAGEVWKAKNRVDGFFRLAS